ncbi:MAG: HlyD family type I secretion periplasmic adaptor subunit, partial [Rhodospirillaceae bacterium]|nr:HlyD family type I secretion periplasmic adaptor subunit [Rhodospirillaceae bacterium]
MKRRAARHTAEIDFLPDADAIERGPLPRSVRLTLHVLLAAFASLILWAAVSPLEKIVVAKGRLVNPLPNIVVQPFDTSIIQSIVVRPGQVVRKGQLLATLDPTFAGADEAQLRNRLQSLDTQTAGLRSELAGKTAGAAGRSADTDAQLQAQLASERQANYTAQKSRIEQNIARLEAGL